ncbi:MAG: hypothetical protein D6677_07505 [Calditrichaeota bacterium]|nr:MAG: hypothetical protein D6677_07505 [Calditrichota bacterium]
MMRMLIYLLWAGILFTCTENSLFDDPVQIPQNLTVEGQVRLSDGTTSEGVYVYLEGFDISTVTDADGRFKLELPNNPRSQPGGGISGAYYIWYYCDDYRPARSLTIVNEGQFQYGKADVDADGRIISTVTLSRLLEVRAYIQPGTISLSAGEPVDVTLTVRNLVDSVQLNAYLGKRYEPGAFFIRSQQGTYRAMRLDRAKNTLLTLDSMEIWNLTVPPDSLAFEPGTYTLIPYVKVRHDLPQELMDRFGRNAANFTEEFLNIPSRIGRAGFKVTP